MRASYWKDFAKAGAVAAIKADASAGDISIAKYTFYPFFIDDFLPLLTTNSSSSDIFFSLYLLFGAAVRKERHIIVV
jgi:hypothetical protein